MTSHITLLPTLDARERTVPWRRIVGADADGGSVVHLCARAHDAPRLAAVAAAIADVGVFAQRALDAAPAPCLHDVFGELGVTVPVARIPAARDERVAALEAELTGSRCVALLLHADDETAVLAALAAVRLGIAVVRVGGPAEDRLGRTIARLAELQFLFAEEDARSFGGRCAPERIHVVGNPLIDLVRAHARQAIQRAAWMHHGVRSRDYVLAVLTGDPDPRVALAIAQLAGRTPVLVEAHPGWEQADVGRARRLGALGVIEHLSLVRFAGAIVTDSRRVQEEAAAIGIRCHAFGAVREWSGAGAIVTATDPSGLADVVPTPYDPTPCAIALWDGRAGARLAHELVAGFARLRLA